MCGIFGAFGGNDTAVAPEVAARALAILQHRGPDDFGVLGWCGQGPPRVSRSPEQLSGSHLLLVHRRLAIIDLSAGGAQPMVTEDGRYGLIFNGEIYNYIELRAELERAGVVFRSSSDTEVLLRGYAHWGPALLPRLIGMFAFAVLDTHKRTLFLARDFFGIKPLYYTSLPRGGFAFASELKALLESGVSRRVDPVRIQSYLLQGRTDDGDRTFFEDIKQLPAGHYLEVPLTAGAAASAPVRYWSLRPSPRSDLSFEQAAEQTRAVFLDNIRLHLRSDVSLGAALSGGIDSSAIVGAIRHLHPDLELHAFTYIADDPALSEQHWSEMVGRQAGTIAHQVRAQPSDLKQDLLALIGIQDEPFASTSIYAQQRVFRAAHEAGITVMLDGQGADELMGGYWPYVLSRMGSLISDHDWPGAAELARSSLKRGHVPSRALLVGTAGFMLPKALRTFARPFFRADRDQPGWLNPGWFQRRGIDLVQPAALRASQMLRRDLVDSVSTGLPALLRYEDRNSMAYSIESRVPFLTQNFAELVLSFPEQYLIAADGSTKAVFRRAMRGIVPDPILDRTDKIGFATPETRWLLSQSDWVESVLGSEAARRIPALQPARLRSVWDASKKSGVLEGPVWRWLNLILWSEAFAVEYA